MSDSTDGGEFEENLSEVVAAADPIPFDVLDALRDGFRLRAADADVAELVHDSLLDEVVGVRSSTTDRQLSFAGPRISVEMSVYEDRRRVVGQLLPPSPGEVEIRSLHGSMFVEVDELGRFFTEHVPEGPVSFRCRGEEGGEPVVTVTDWLVL